MIKNIFRKLNNFYWERRIITLFNGENLHSISTHLKVEEKVQLYKLSSSLKSKPVVVEVGSYLGASTCFLAMGMKLNNGKVYAVDTWKNSAMTEGARDTFAEFTKNTLFLKEFITALRGESRDIACRFDMKIDLLFIDGDHSYEGCISDWVSWKKHLADDAIVIFHDIGWAEGVQRVVSEEVAPLAKKDGRLPNLYWAWL